MRKQIVIEILASLSVFLFLYASGSKWIAFKTFVDDMNNQPFSNQFTPWLVWAIPLTEVSIVLLLAFEKTRLIGFGISLALMLVFTSYSVAVLLHAFKFVPCSCGGIIKNLTWPQNLLLNLLFVVVSVAGILLTGNRSADLVKSSSKV